MKTLSNLLKTRSYLRKVCLLCIFISLNACETNVEVAPNKTLDTKALADLIEERLKDNCVGYQFTIGYKGENKVLRAGGDARLAPDANPRAMTILDRYTLASVSKNITATAIMQLLASKKRTLDDKIAPYLPSHWKISDPLKTVTFRQVMTHTSGLYDGDTDYASLKKLADTATRKSPNQYRNINYALLRFVIVSLSGKMVTSIPIGVSANQLATLESKQALEYGEKYIEYCQENIFNKIGLTQNVNCKQVNLSENPGLCYQFPKQGKLGDPWWDFTAFSGSQGWYMTSAQLATYLGSLLYTEKILPNATTTQMKKEGLGFFAGSTPQGIKCYSHSGYYPGSWNKGELNTLAITYENGIVVSLIINSQYVNAKYGNNYGIALHNAMDTWTK